MRRTFIVFGKLLGLVVSYWTIGGIVWLIIAVFSWLGWSDSTWGSSGWGLGSLG